MEYSQESSDPQQNTTPSPHGEKTGRKYKKPLLLSLVVLLIAASVAGLYYWQQSKIDPLQAQIQQLERENNALKATKDAGGDSATSDAESASVTLPIVGFIPDGKFTAEEKKELMEKVVNPMHDYTPEQYAAVVIEYFEPNKFLNADDKKYIITTLGEKDGQWGGFMMGSKSTGTIEWWVPECMDTCTFSDEYKSKYPEVVKRAS